MWPWRRVDEVDEGMKYIPPLRSHWSRQAGDSVLLFILGSCLLSSASNSSIFCFCFSNHRPRQDQDSQADIPLAPLKDQHSQFTGTWGVQSVIIRDFSSKSTQARSFHNLTQYLSSKYVTLQTKCLLKLSPKDFCWLSVPLYSSWGFWDWNLLWTRFL